MTSPVLCPQCGAAIPDGDARALAAQLATDDHDGAALRPDAVRLVCSAPCAAERQLDRPSAIVLIAAPS